MTIGLLSERSSPGEFTCLRSWRMPKQRALREEIDEYLRFHGSGPQFAPLRGVSSKMMLFLAVFLSLGSIASSPRSCAETAYSAAATQPGDPAACAGRYNALLAEAKASLTKGDRRAAIVSLLSAQSQLRRCQKLEEENSGAVALAMCAPPSIGLE